MTLRIFLCAALSVPPLLSAQTVPPSAAEEDPVAMNPFVINAEDDVGYRGRNAVIATGFSRDVQKTPVTINIVTESFIRDAGFTSYADVSDFLPSVSVEPDPYQLGSQLYSRGHQSSYYAQDGTRRYIETDLGNAARLEVIKGPATLFFGRAQPGGILNFATARPSFRQKGSIEATYSSWDRTTVRLGVQGPIKKDLLAYRVDGMWQEGDSWMDHSFSDKRQGRASLLFTPFNGRLSIKGEIERVVQNSAGNSIGQIVYNPFWFSDYEGARPEHLAWARSATGRASIAALRNLPEDATNDQIQSVLRSRWRENDSNWANDTRDAFALAAGVDRTDPRFWSFYPERRVGVTSSDTRFGHDYNAAGRGSFNDQDMFLYGVDATLNLGRHFAARVAVSHFDLERENLYSVDADRIWADRVFRFNVLRQRATNDATTYTVELTSNFDVGPTRHTVLVGGRRFDDQFVFTAGRLLSLRPDDIRRSAGSIVTAGWNPDTDPYFSLADVVADDPFVGAFTAPNDNVEEGIYGSHVLELFDGRLGTLVGARLERYQNFDVKADKVVPMAGISWAVTPDIVLFAGTSRSFEPNQPVIDGLGAQSDVRADRSANPSPAREGEGFDIGVKFGLLEGRLSGSIAYYETIRRNDFRITDEVRTEQDPRNLDADPSNNVRWYLFGGERTSRGVDVELTYQPTANLGLIFAYGYLPTAEISANPSITNPNQPNQVGTRSLNSPEHKVSLWTRYAFNEGAFNGLSLGAGVSHVDQVSISTFASDRAYAPSYTLARFSVDYTFDWAGQKIGAGIVVANAFDKEYHRGVYRGSPREVTARLRMSF